jgi:hypothetical protein
MSDTQLLRFDREIVPGQTLLPPIRRGERIQRPILLFRAGTYPDKGVTVTTAQLHQVVERFHAGRTQGKTVPVKVEHRDSPLDPLGEVVALYVQGEELFAMVEFSAGIHTHIETRGVRSFSAAFLRDSLEEGGGFTLKEASLVTFPRIADAGFLDVEERLTGFRREGKITPAMEPHLRRLFTASPVITFTGETVDIAQEVTMLLESLPILLARGGVIPGEGVDLRARKCLSPEVQRIASAMGVPTEKVG